MWSLLIFLSVVAIPLVPCREAILFSNSSSLFASYISPSRITEYFGSIIDLAKESDVLVVACALTEETTRIVNREVLDALGSKGYLVNIARGLIVDETELLKALVEGRLAGAGLNVVEKEPRVPEELLKLPNIAFFPHGAASTMNSLREMATLCVANVEAHFAGEPVITPVP